MTERDELLDVDQESVGRNRGSVEITSGESAHQSEQRAGGLRCDA